MDEVRAGGWTVHDLLSFTRASTLILASLDNEPPVVLKAGFGSDHVLAELDPEDRKVAYGFYWYRAMTPDERRLTRDDFRHEIDTTRAAAGADHVVQLLEQGSTDRFDWYTMPYVTGGNFGALLLDPDRDISHGLSILTDVAAGLIELHQRGIVHRDVYQENVLVSAGRGLITDLGAARRINIPRGPVSRGPEVHWPPEYGVGYATATPAADVFSLAVLTYRFLVRELPRAFADIVSVGPVMSAALAHEPADRPSMAELRDALILAASPSYRQETPRWTSVPELRPPG